MIRKGIRSSKAGKREGKGGGKKNEAYTSERVTVKKTTRKAVSLSLAKGYSRLKNRVTLERK